MHLMLLTCLPTLSPSPTACLSKFAWGRVNVNSSLLQELSLDGLALDICSQRLFAYRYIEHIMSCLASDEHGTYTDPIFMRLILWLTKLHSDAKNIQLTTRTFCPNLCNFHQTERVILVGRHSLQSRSL